MHSVPSIVKPGSHIGCQVSRAANVFYYLVDGSLPVLRCYTPYGMTADTPVLLDIHCQLVWPVTTWRCYRYRHRYFFQLTNRPINLPFSLCRYDFILIVINIKIHQQQIGFSWKILICYALSSKGWLMNCFKRQFWRSEFTIELFISCLSADNLWRKLKVARALHSIIITAKVKGKSFWIIKLWKNTY